MAYVYAKLVKAGLKTLDQVPAEFVDDVKRILGIED